MPRSNNLSIATARRTLGVALMTATASMAVPPVVASPADPPQPFTTGTHKVLTDQRVSGVRRSYYVHVPTGYDGVTPLPVVLALHGAFSTARDLERYSGLSRLADRHGFLVVYPQGIGLGDLFRHWNSGHCCGKARKLDLDDVGFALSAVDDVARRNPVDRSRVYVMGHSNGGMLAYRIAAERSDVVAAVAVVSATIGGTPSADEPEWTIPRPAHPVPVLAVHGRADENVPHDGGRGSGSHGTSTTISVARSINLWVEADACDPRPQVEMTHDGRVERQTWFGCGDDTEVVLYSLEGWGHEWPGGPVTEKLTEGDPLRDFDAAEIIWEFFKGRQRAS
jgi:polyhydroxybutyrate depolymerase